MSPVSLPTLSMKTILTESNGQDTEAGKIAVAVALDGIRGGGPGNSGADCVPGGEIGCSHSGLLDKWKWKIDNKPVKTDK